MIAFPAALSLAVPGMAQAPATKSSDQVKTSSAKKVVEAAPAPTDKDIADAKAKGMVWENTGTKVYHKDGQFYGKTKRGKFMTEDDAKKAGNRSAQEPAAQKSKAGVKK
jgi:alkyl sulfatase BDS1-like metallo-beta-lactamase superfamily hydrolase